MPGRYYEQWTLGDRINHQPHRTVTETDNLLISALTHNPQPLHLDETYAEATEFGRIVVNGTFTFSLLVGLSVGDTTLGTLVANLGYDKVRMPKPVFIGDTLRAETEVVALKDSQSRPDAGIVTFEHRMFNQRDEMVCVMERSALMQRLWIVGERRDQQIVRLGHRPVRLMVDPVAQLPLFVIAPGHHPSPFSIRTSKAPSLTCAPAAALSSATLPSNGAVRLCSIFIASSVSSFWPFVTASPAATSSAMILPGMGETIAPSPAAAPAAPATSRPRGTPTRKVLPA